MEISFLAEAKRAWHEGQVEHVKASCLRYLSEHHDDPFALRLLAKAQGRERDWQAALESWRRLCGHAPEAENAAIQIARCLLRLGMTQEAEEAFRKVLERDPEHEESLRRVGRLVIDRGEWDAAKPLWERLHALQPEAVEPIRQLIRCSRRLGHKAEAVHLLARLVQLEPGDGEAWLTLGRLRAERKDWPEAAGALRHAYEIAGPDATILWELANAALEAGRLDEAESHFRRLGEVRGKEDHQILASLARVTAIREHRDRAAHPGDSPECTEAGMRGGPRKVSGPKRHKPREAAVRAAGSRVKDMLRSVKGMIRPSGLAEARSAWHAGEMERVERVCEDFVAEKPEDSEALCLLAKAQTNQGHWEEALDTWQRLCDLELAGDAPPFQVARCLFKLGRLEESEQAFRRVLQRDPDHQESLLRVARLVTKRRDWADARPLWERLHRLQPDAVEPVRQLVGCCRHLGEKAEALHFLSRLIEFDPGDCEPWRIMGRLHAERREWPEAIKALKRALEIAGPDTNILRALANATFAAKQMDESEAYFREILETHGEDEHALLGLARIASAREQWREAIDLWRRRERVKPDAPETPREIARLLRRAGDDAQAEALLRERSSGPDANPGCMWEMAELLESQSRTSEAIATRWALCRATPSDVPAWRHLIRLLRTVGNGKDAEGALREASKANESDPQTVVDLAEMCLTFDLAELAQELYEHALKLSPDGQVQRLGRARFALQAGRLGEAYRLLSSLKREGFADPRLTEAILKAEKDIKTLGHDPAAVLAGDESASLELPAAVFDALRRLSSGRKAEEKVVSGRVILVISSIGLGGTERQLVNTIRGLVDHYGSKVRSVIVLRMESRGSECGEESHLERALASLPIDIRTYGQSGDDAELALSTTDEERELLALLPYGLRNRTLSLVWCFRLWRPAVVHAWRLNAEAALAGLVARVPRIIMSEQSMAPPTVSRAQAGDTPDYFRALYKALVESPRVLLTANSRAGVKDYRRWVARTARKPQVLTNGILPPSRPSLPGGHSTSGTTGPVVAWVSRVSAEKRPLLWIETAAEIARALPCASFIIAGDGPLLDDMVQRADQLGLSGCTCFIGSTADVESVYASCDLVLLTSLVEGLPNVLIEAQLHGVPVVSTDVGGCRETVLPGITGWIVRSDTPQALARAAIRALDATPRMRRVRAALSIATSRRRFSIERMVNRTLDLYGLPRVKMASCSPTIVIAILFHNRVGQTIDCIRSFLDSGVPIHILDNDSEAGQRKILDQFAQKHSQIKVHDSGRNLGVGVGRNRLLEESDEDWLFFVDSDIVMSTRDWLDRSMSHISRNPDVEVLSPVLHDVNEGRDVGQLWFQIAGTKVLSRTITNPRGLSNRFSGGAAIVSRRLFSRVGPYDQKMFVGYEDFELAIRAMRNGKPVRALFIPDIVLRHEHRLAETAPDKEAAQIRYKQETLAASAQRIDELHGVHVSDNWRQWAQQQVDQLVSPRRADSEDARSANRTSFRPCTASTVSLR